MYSNILDYIKKTITLLFILGTVFSLNTYAEEEVWFHLNSSYTLKKYTFIPELHFRNRFSDSEKTKAFKLNALADKFIVGAAYFDFPKELNETRLYTGFFYKLRKLNSRNLVEFRQLNEGDLFFRFRSKIEYEFNPNKLFMAEILFQQGLIKQLELRAGLNFRRTIGKHSISVAPTIISTQYIKNRYVIMIGESF